MCAAASEEAGCWKGGAELRENGRVDLHGAGPHLFLLSPPTGPDRPQYEASRGLSVLGKDILARNDPRKRFMGSWQTQECLAPSFCFLPFLVKNDADA